MRRGANGHLHLAGAFENMDIDGWRVGLRDPDGDVLHRAGDLRGLGRLNRVPALRIASAAVRYGVASGLLASWALTGSAGVRISTVRAALLAGSGAACASASIAATCVSLRLCLKRRWFGLD